MDLKFTKAQREKYDTTVLVSGLTMAQDYFVEGALKGLGYDVMHLECPDTDALRVGKEFGNRGQCNPTYFTVGNLVKFLCTLRDKHGMTSEEIINKYVFLTAGACGPCRFGMYVTEYRKALRDAGFDGFRVLLFQQKGGFAQATGEDALGLEFNPAFFIAIVKALSPATWSTPWATACAPTRSSRAPPTARSRAARRTLRGARKRTKSIFGALFRCPQAVRARSRSTGCAPGQGGHHRRVLGHDHRGRRQLPAPALPREGRRRVRRAARDGLAPLQRSGRSPATSRERKHLKAADGGPAGLQGYDEFGITKRLAAMRVADKALRVVFQCFAWPGGLEALPPRRHGRDRRDRPALLLQRPARRRGPHGGRQADPQRRDSRRRT